MTEAESVATTVSAADKIATYFVVPIVPDEGSIESVLYYEEVAKSDKWKKVSSKGLNGRGQGCNAGAVKLFQPSVEAIIGHTDLPSNKLDHTVNLYAGVAKTLYLGDNLGGVFALGSDKALTIPVTTDTVRGLILVFSQAPAVGMPPFPISQLIASTDPEIKNSTGGT